VLERAVLLSVSCFLAFFLFLSLFLSLSVSVSVSVSVSLLIHGVLCLSSSVLRAHYLSLGSVLFSTYSLLTDTCARHRYCASLVVLSAHWLHLIRSLKPAQPHEVMRTERLARSRSHDHIVLSTAILDDQ
jgi:hypothetical protein